MPAKVRIRLKTAVRTQGGASDNPLSDAFLPLTERTDRDTARWWALRSMVEPNPRCGVYDAPDA